MLRSMFDPLLKCDDSHHAEGFRQQPTSCFGSPKIQQYARQYMLVHHIYTIVLCWLFLQLLSHGHQQAFVCIFTICQSLSQCQSCGVGSLNPPTWQGGLGPNATIRPPCLAQTAVASHFNATPANMPTRAVQGRRRYARTRCRSSIPTTSRSLPTFSGGGSWAEPPLKTAHKRIPTEGVRLRA
jgi:hypothetical protein